VTEARARARIGTMSTTSKIRPLGDRIVLRRIEAEEKSPGGIVIPDAAKEKPSQGLVVAVGPGLLPTAAALATAQRVPLDVKEGDRVLFGKYAGTEVRVDGADLVILRQEDLLAVLE